MSDLASRKRGLSSGLLAIGVVLHVLSIGHALNFEIYGDGRGAEENSPVLQNGDTYCVRQKPFTVICSGMSDSITAVTWYFDDQEAFVDSSAPFTVAGELDELPRPWTEFSGSVKVKCAIETGEFVEAQLESNCADQAVSEPDDPALFAPELEEDPGDDFVLIDSQSFINDQSLPPGWTVLKTSIIFKQGGGGGIDQPPNGDTGYLIYRFTAPTSAVYALAFDSTTRDETEHNDVWLRVPEPGLTRRRLFYENGKTNARIKDPTDWWIKVCLCLPPFSIWAIVPTVSTNPR